MNTTLVAAAAATEQAMFFWDAVSKLLIRLV
jgi:hypothetical protein